MTKMEIAKNITQNILWNGNNSIEELCEYFTIEELENIYQMLKEAEKEHLKKFT